MITVRAAQVDTTPDRPLPLFGRGDRAAPSGAIVSRLEANVAIFETEEERTPHILVSLDALYPSAALADAVRQNLTAVSVSLGPDRLLFVASHTHNAPALDGTKPRLGACDASYVAEVAKRIADTIAGLVSQEGSPLHPQAGIDHCTGSVYRRQAVPGLNTKRLRFERRIAMTPNPSVQIDRSLRLVTFGGREGAPVCALWSWPCHAVVEPESAAISADYPAVVREALRQAFQCPELPVLYFPGFSADIRPNIPAFPPVLRQRRWIGFGRRFGTASLDQCRQFHETLRAGTVRAVADLTPVPTGKAGLETRNRDLALSEVFDPPPRHDTLSVTGMTIGPVRIVAVSAEVSCHYGKYVDAVEASLTFATGCAQQVFGYLPTGEQMVQGGYEAEGFRHAFSLEGTFREGFEARVADALSPNPKASQDTGDTL